MRKKNKLYLIKSKSVDKVYELVTVYLIDESVYTFDLAEWDYSVTDSEWLQFYKRDNSSMECFYTNNIVRVSFAHKSVKSVDAPIIKPVKPVA